MPVENARHAADKIQSRQRVNEAQEIAGDDLVKLQAHAFGVDDTQAKQPFADRLAAPRPFTGDRITDAENKITQRIERHGNILTENSHKQHNPAKQPQEYHDAEQINDPRQAACHGAGKELGEHNALGRANLELGRSHGVLPFNPDLDRNRNSRTSSTRPNAILPM